MSVLRAVAYFYLTCAAIFGALGALGAGVLWAVYHYSASPEMRAMDKLEEKRRKSDGRRGVMSDGKGAGMPLE